MELINNIKSDNYVINNFSKILSSLSKSKSPVIITHDGEAKAVIQDVKSYEKEKKHYYY